MSVSPGRYNPFSGESRARRYPFVFPEHHLDLASAGMFRDVQPEVMPENGVYDLVDFLTDVHGMARKRGGWTVITGTNQRGSVRRLVSARFTAGAAADFARLVGWVYSTKAGATTSMVVVDTTTGAVTDVGVAVSVDSTVLGRPFQHQDWVIAPNLATGQNGTVAVYAGASGAKAAVTYSTGGVSFAVTLGNDTVTVTPGTSGFTTANLEVGMTVSLFGTGATEGVYEGRITEILTATTFRVAPMPAATVTATTGKFNRITLLDPRGKNTAGVAAWTAGCGCSWQNRILLGNIRKFLGAGYDSHPNRIVWTVLTGEVPTAMAANAGVAGQTQLAYESIEAGNFLDVPGNDPIVALVPVGEGTLLVLTTRRAFRLTGNLSTQTSVSTSYGFDLKTISTTIGCLAENTVQLTPRGAVFADSSGVYLYDGARLKPIMQGRVANYYRDRIRAGDKVRGSMLLRGGTEYVLCLSGTDGALRVNLDTLAWGRLSNCSFFDSTPDALDPSIIYAARWWDDTATSPTFTGGQIARADSIYTPASTNVNDGDGTAVLPSMTKVFRTGDTEQEWRWRRFELYQRITATGTPTAQLSVAATLDPAGAAYTNIGTTAKTSSTPVGFRFVQKGPALAVKITLLAAATTFELHSARVGKQPMRAGHSG